MEVALETEQSCVWISVVLGDFSGVLFGFGRLTVLAGLAGVMLSGDTLDSTDVLRIPDGWIFGDAWNRLMIVDNCVEMIFISC